MAQESCNLDKDEAEILKATSSSSSSSTPPAAAAAASSPPPPPPSPSSLLTKPSQEFPPQRTEELETQTTNSLAEDSSAPKPAEKSSLASQYVNRCFSCQKRVGLTGFRCRCGHLFCPRHRYSDTHDCSFDYKAAGRAEISKNNPLVRAAKIIKI